jgi:hypothetical protein
MASILVLSAILGRTLAQRTTLTVPFVGYDDASFAASVVSVNSAATTIALACPSSECGLFPQHTLVFGTSTYNVDMSDPNTDFTATQDCVIAASSAVCKETAGGSEANFPGSSTVTYEASEIESLIVTVTKGAEKLSGNAEATATGTGSASASMGNPASVPTASATQDLNTDDASRSATASGTGSTGATPSTGAAAGKVAVLGRGFALAAVGLLGGLLS